jgi:hypothetical protein
MRAFCALLFALLTVASASPAAAKSYSAERFDSQIRILEDGSIQVVETVVFRFEEGSFTYVFRELPRRRTDDIQIVSASMDGRPLSFGKESGQVEVAHRSKVRATWHFAPRSNSSHTFELTYVVRGVVQRLDGRDVFEWNALPTERNYSIDSSNVTVSYNASPIGRAIVTTSKIAESTVQPGDGRTDIQARRIAKNGRLRARLDFEQGAIIAAAPLWQQRQITARELAPRWFAAASAVLAFGAIVLFGLRQRYDSPSGAGATSASVDATPDGLRPGIAGAVAANGSPSFEHAMAVLFALADRGIVRIEEEPRKWGQRHFTLHRNRSSAAVAPEEAAVLDGAFRHKGEDLVEVPFAKARTRLASKMRDFKNAVKSEMASLGLLDDDRKRVRSRYLSFGVGTLILALALVVPAALLVPTYDGWPFLIVGAVACLSVISFIVYGALTPLSNEGVRRAERWRSYRKYLKDVARGNVHLRSESPSAVLPFATALGLAGLWSKFVKKNPVANPPWFEALAASGDDAFPAFIAAGGATDGGGGGGGGGGAAGGGGSGAG